MAERVRARDEANDCNNTTKPVNGGICSPQLLVARNGGWRTNAMLPVAILSGGLGTRMRMVSATLPKALIPVAGKPFILHQLDWLSSQGVVDVVFCLGFAAEAIQHTLERAGTTGMRIRFSFDGPNLKGTAGSLARARPLLAPRFLALYGDSLLTCDLASIADEFSSSRDLGLMTVLRNDDRLLPSNVRVEGDRVVAYDKHAVPGTMTHIDYGLNAFAADAFNDIDVSEPTDLSTLHQWLIGRRALRAYPVATRFYEIGSPSGLAETEMFLASQTHDGG